MKSILTILLLIIATVSFSQTNSVTFGMSKGTYSHTTKQIGLSHNVTPTYSVKGFYSIDNIRNPVKGVRQIYTGAVGFMANKELEFYGGVSYANDRFKRQYLKNTWGAMYGVNYNFKQVPFNVGAQLSTLKSFNQLPTFTVGYRF